jgi:DNA-binding transcriptional LysR family regulator
MPLEFGDVRTVSFAARLGSFSRAAEAANLSQPAFSRRVAEIEKTLGVTLFERLPRGVRPTAACLAFLRHAEAALTSVEDGRAAALEVEKRRGREVAIGVLENLCEPGLIAACHGGGEISGPMIAFRPRSLSAEISADLLAGATRLGLRYNRDPDPQLDAIWVADDPIVIACASSHPLAAAGRATMDELERAQWIGNPAALDRADSEDLPSAVFRGWSAMKMAPIFARLQLLEAGCGLAMVRRDCIREQVARGSIVELRTPLALSIPVFLTWRRGAGLGEAADQLRAQIKAFYQPSPDERAG